MCVIFFSKSGCPFGVWLSVNADGNALVVTKVEPQHNHEILEVIRRLRGDMIEVFKIVHDFYHLQAAVKHLY